MHPTWIVPIDWFPSLPELNCTAPVLSGMEWRHTLTSVQKTSSLYLTQRHSGFWSVFAFVKMMVTAVSADVSKSFDAKPLLNPLHGRQPKQKVTTSVPLCAGRNKPQLSLESPCYLNNNPTKLILILHAATGGGYLCTDNRWFSRATSQQLS